MPLANKTFDRLYHCLYPSSTLPVHSCSFAALKRPLLILTQCYHLRLQSHVEPTSTTSRIALYSTKNIYNREWNYRSQKPEPNAGELRGQQYMRELDIDKAYFKLRQIALTGGYAQTRICVDIILRERGEEPTARLYEALLLANVDPENGSASEAASILEEMVEEGIAPDAAVYHATLRVLAVHPNYLLRHHILQELRQKWFSLSRDGWHDVVAGFIRDREIELAFDTMEQLRREGIRIETWLYDMMIYTLCSAEEFDAAVSLMGNRIADGHPNISATVWYHLLDTASRAFHHSATLFAYRARVETEYLNPPSGVCVNILNTAARHANTYLATSVLRLLSRRSGNPVQLYHYEALLESYVTAGDIRTAITLLTIMTAAGHAPNEGSTRPIYTYLCQSPMLPVKALSVLKDLYDQNREVPVQAANVVMQASIHHNNLEFAFDLYKKLNDFTPDLKPDTASFNILFRGCALERRKDTAMFLASEMVAMKIPRNSLTYDRLILVCLSSDKSHEDAWRYFEEMRELGWWPRDGTTLALARKACKHGERRVWELGRNSDGRGMPLLKLQTLVQEHWRGDPEEARKELNRDR